MGERTGCVPHHLASKPGHLSGTALQLRLAWAGLPEDAPHARGPTAPPPPPPPTPPIVRGQLAATGAGDRGPRPWGRLLGLGLAGLHRKVRIGPGTLGAVKSSSGVRGQYGARMEGPGAVRAFSASSSSSRAQGTLSCMGLGNQPWRNLPNLAPSYATMNEPFSPGPGGSRREERVPRSPPNQGYTAGPLAGVLIGRPYRPSQADKSRI